MKGRCQGLGSSAALRGPQLQSRCIYSSPARRRLALSVQAAKTDNGPSLAIVGVTGAVGQEFLRVKSPLAKPFPRCNLEGLSSLPHLTSLFLISQHFCSTTYLERKALKKTLSRSSCARALGGLPGKSEKQLFGDLEAGGSSQ